MDDRVARLGSVRQFARPSVLEPRLLFRLDGGLGRRERVEGRALTRGAWHRIVFVTSDFVQVLKVVDVAR